MLTLVRTKIARFLKSADRQTRLRYLAARRDGLGPVDAYAFATLR